MVRGRSDRRGILYLATVCNRPAPSKPNNTQLPGLDGFGRHDSHHRVGGGVGNSAGDGDRGSVDRHAWVRAVGKDGDGPSPASLGRGQKGSTVRGRRLVSLQT